MCQHDKAVLTLADGSTLSFPWHMPSKMPFMLTKEMMERPMSAHCVGLRPEDLKKTTAAVFCNELPQLLSLG